MLQVNTLGVCGTYSATLVLLSGSQEAMGFYFPATVRFLGVVDTNAAIALLPWHISTIFINTSSLNKSMSCSIKFPQYDQ